MKTILKTALVLTFAFISQFSNAQSTKPKLGYVDISVVIQSLPAYQDAQKKLQGYVNQLQAVMDTMQNEYQQKLAAYQQDEANLEGPVKETRQQEIIDLQNRIQKLQDSSSDQINQKQMELLQPLEDKVMAAINSVAKQKGYTYIFDSTKGSGLLYGPPSDNVTDFVKAELGVQ